MNRNFIRTGKSPNRNKRLNKRGKVNKQNQKERSNS